VETLTAAAPEPPPLSGDKFLWPVAAGRILMGFGPAAGGQQNDGINIAAAEGTPVRAVENGVVAYAGNELRGFGNLLLIRHADGWMSAYAHNETLLVKRGDTVKRGEIIARVGKTGNVSEPQLHFELRRGTRAVDPMPYLGEGGSAITPAASPGGRQDPG
ncbi:MAG: M23 family metallopeptidase, partial [Rhodospirillaceae bacterium]|nr:M23 family metallopeptidase [Rhodospirillaceae bacterium]